MRYSISNNGIHCGNISTDLKYRQKVKSSGVIKLFVSTSNEPEIIFDTLLKYFEDLGFELRKIPLAPEHTLQTKLEIPKAKMDKHMKYLLREDKP